MTKNRILFFSLESFVGFLFGFTGTCFIGELKLDSGFTWGIPFLVLTFIMSSMIGIAIPGYFQCKQYNDLKSFKSAILSSFVWLIASLVFLFLLSMIIAIPNPLLIGLAIIISVVGFNFQVQE